MTRALSAAAVLLSVLAISLAALAVYTAHPAYADVPVPPPSFNPISNCNNNPAMPALQDWQLTQKVVTCIEITIQGATLGTLAVVSAYATPIALAVLTLAIILFGLRWNMAEQGFSRESVAFLLRAGLVLMFFANLGGLGALPFAVLRDSLAMVSGGWQPWAQIDDIMGRMFGFLPGTAMFQGILGFIAASVFSSGFGAFVFFAGFAMILTLISFMYRAVYSYLISYMLVGYLTIISPLAIIMAFFRWGDQRYFRRWLDMLIAAILQPILIFAFLQMFLVIVSLGVDQLFQVFGGNAFVGLWRNNDAAFSWSMIADPSMISRVEGGIGAPQSMGVIQSFLTPSMARAVEMNLMNVPVIDFGPDNLRRTHLFILQMASLGVVCFLLRSMMELVPRIAEDIAGASTGIGLHELPLASEIKSALGKLG